MVRQLAAARLLASAQPCACFSDIAVRSTTTPRAPPPLGFERNHLSMLAWKAHRNAQTETVVIPTQTGHDPPDQAAA